MKPYQEVRLGQRGDLEILIGTLAGAALAAAVVWFVTVIVFSIA